MKRINLKKVAQEIRKHKNFLITAHTSPEGDAIGAELAFYHLLKKLGKRAFIVNEDPTPVEYNFFPSREDILVYSPKLKNISFDCLAVLDCSDLNRTGQVHKLNKDNKPVINIDHHISNINFGKVNLVDPYASSASEIVCALFKEMGVVIDKDTALLLYVGIMTDTGSFRYSNTSAYTHKVVGELMRYNLDVRGIYKNIYENIPYFDMQFLIKILARMHLSAGGKIGWVEIPEKLLRHKKLSFDLSDHILSFVRSIKDTQVVALFRENLGSKRDVRVNLRSSGQVDVNKVAQAFGGGGHKTAAGCTVIGKLSNVRRKVLTKLKESLS